MTRYSVINNTTGEVVLETDSLHLQAASRVLQATKDRLQAHQIASYDANLRQRTIRYGNARKQPYGVVRHGTRKKHRRSALEQVAHDFMVCLGVNKKR